MTLKEQKHLSKYLSLILRHKPDVIGIILDLKIFRAANVVVLFGRMLHYMVKIYRKKRLKMQLKQLKKLIC